MLGTIQRLITLGEQFAWLFVAHWVDHRDTDAQGQVAERAGRVMDIQAGDGCMDARGDLLGTLLIGVGENDRELLATVAAGRITFALQAVAQGCTDSAQGVVTGEVAECIVVGLEVVDIQHQQRQGRVEAAQAAPFGQQLLVEVTAVVQSGQAVEL